MEKDETVEALDGALPGLNCGACGYAGCSGYAEALAEKKEDDITKCKPGEPILWLPSVRFLVLKSM